jgi:hypothetical protein
MTRSNQNEKYKKFNEKMDELIAAGYEPTGRIRDDIEKEANAAKDRFGLTPFRDQSQLLECGIKAEQFWLEVDRFLITTFDSKSVESPLRDPITSEIRVWEGFVIKIGPALRSVVPKTLGLIVGTIFATPFYFLNVALFGYGVGDLITTLWNAFENIDDPDERAVFERLHVLSCQMARDNFEALKNKSSHQHAYEFYSPSTEQICEVCRLDRIDDEHTRAALERLKKREIVAESNGAWRVRI